MSHPALAFGRKILEMQPFSQIVGLELVEAAEGQLQFEAAITDQLTQHYGYVHGGALCTIADIALTFAGGGALGAEVITQELKINYLRPAIGDRLIARAEVLSSGRRVAVTTCKVFVVKDGEEKLCAAAQGTIMTIPPKS